MSRVTRASPRGREIARDYTALAKTRPSTPALTSSGYGMIADIAQHIGNPRERTTIALVIYAAMRKSPSPATRAPSIRSVARGRVLPHSAAAYSATSTTHCFLLQMYNERTNREGHVEQSGLLNCFCLSCTMTRVWVNELTARVYTHNAPRFVSVHVA